MKSEELLNELWCLRYALWLLGFEPEELEVHGNIRVEGKPQVGIVIRAQDKELAMPIDKSNDPKLEEKLNAFNATTANDSSRLDKIWKDSKTQKRFYRIVRHLKEHGFKVQGPGYRDPPPPEVG